MTRRDFIKATGISLPLPLLSANQKPKHKAPMRLVVIGNPFGMHPESFFPKTFGKDYETSLELKCLDWIRDEMTIFSHIDHNMESGHSKESAFLSGILKRDASQYPDGNISLDQMIGEHLRSEVRFPTLNVSAGPSIDESWTRTGVPTPILNTSQMYNKIFKSSSASEKQAEREVWQRNQEMLKVMHGQHAYSFQNLGKEDKAQMDQYLSSLSDLNREINSMRKWQNNSRPKFSLPAFTNYEQEYNAIFDMLLLALQSDSTRVATVTFPKQFRTLDLGLPGNYHAYTHNGTKGNLVEGLQQIEIFQLMQTSRFIKKLQATKEPEQNGSMLDHTIVMFGSSMGYGGTHSNRNLPILLAGGGLKHQGHVDMKRKNGENTLLCNLYLSILHKFGIERNKFNASTGTVNISFLKRSFSLLFYLRSFSKPTQKNQALSLSKTAMNVTILKNARGNSHLPI